MGKGRYSKLETLVLYEEQEIINRASPEREQKKMKRLK